MKAQHLAKCLYVVVIVVVVVVYAKKDIIFVSSGSYLTGLYGSNVSYIVL